MGLFEHVLAKIYASGLQIQRKFGWILHNWFLHRCHLIGFANQKLPFRLAVCQDEWNVFCGKPASLKLQTCLWILCNWFSNSKNFWLRSQCSYGLMKCKQWNAIPHWWNASRTNHFFVNCRIQYGNVHVFISGSTFYEAFKHKFVVRCALFYVLKSFSKHWQRKVYAFLCFELQNNLDLFIFNCPCLV